MSLKKVVLIIMALGIVGCSYVPRKDLNRKITFGSEVKKGKQNIYLMDLRKYEDIEKEENLENLEEILSKDILSNSKKNYIFSSDFYEKILKLKNRVVEDDEKSYSDYIFMLTKEQKKTLDNMDIKISSSMGEEQGYLNRQVYYWLEKLGEEDKYKGNEYYSELDKNKLMERYFDRFQKIVELFFYNQENYVLEINDYKKIEDIKGYKGAIYFNCEVTGEEIGKIDNKIVIVNENMKTIVDNKIVLIMNGETEYIREYDFKTAIGDEIGLELGKLNQFKDIKIRKKKSNQAKIELESRKIPRFEISVENTWRLD